MKKRVAVVMGGTSHEAEVSLRSGSAVVAALQSAGYEVVEVRLTYDGIDEIPRDVQSVFIALHGGYGENGGIQADLNAIGLPYTGPGAETSALCMDKVATKQILNRAGIAVPNGMTVRMEACPSVCPLPFPVVVKPPRDGSSVGLSKVTEAGQWRAAVALACEQDAAREALAEVYIPGLEWGVGVLNGRALPVIEIQAPNGWYDYRAKYVAGVSRHIFPEPSVLTEKVQRIAEKVYFVTGCRGAVRVDFRVTPEGEAYVLEVNTAPGCTATSLLPDAAAHAGISFSELCAELVSCARCD